MIADEMWPPLSEKQRALGEGIKAFSETDQTDDLKAITVPTLVMQGDDDQVVPYKDASLLQAKSLKRATLKIYPGYPHGLMTTHAEVINAALLAFISRKGA
jgi:non-heme chloroperoxidase